MGGVNGMVENISYHTVSFGSKSGACQFFRKSSDNDKLDHLAFRKRIVQKYCNPVPSGGRHKTSKVDFTFR